MALLSNPPSYFPFLGASHWPPTSKASNHNTADFFCFYVCGMDNFFSETFHQTSALQHQQSKTQEVVDYPVAQQEIPRCEWDFSLTTVVSSNISGAASDVLGVIEFDPSDTIIATGGIARKIRIYNVNSLALRELGDDGHDILWLDHATACDYYICTPAKLSSLRWRPGLSGRVIGSGDYDGVVTEYDLERRIPVFERDEHGGRRVWSVDYSHCDPVMGASGSDDGTMQIWDPRIDGGNSISTVQPSVTQSPVCSVEFNPFGGTLIAVGCADRRTYGYDTRMLKDPLFSFDGHSKTVTYVKFMDSHTMISAGTDGCLKQWDLHESRAIRTHKGHVNSRRFVGLSVWRNGGLIACGSESNQVFVYDKRWGEPIWVNRLEPMEPVCRTRFEEIGWISSVCWRQLDTDSCTLIAGRSDGVVQVFRGKKKLVFV